MNHILRRVAGRVGPLSFSMALLLSTTTFAEQVELDGAVATFGKESRSRVIVLTDMNNEPDDSQTMVRLLMYANEMDVEGLVAVTGYWLRTNVAPELVHERIDAYEQVLPNLRLHAQGWPEPDDLRSVTAAGQNGYGTADVGDGKNSPGSDLIIAAVDSPDPRPVHVGINAGANTLAQALWDVRRDRTPEELATFVSKLRVYDDTGQDDAGAWITKNFPDLMYMRSVYQVFAFMGHTVGVGSNYQGPKVWAADPIAANSWTETQHHDAMYAWVLENIQSGHGPLGALYPDRDFTMEGGGTTTWIGHVNHGLYDPEQRTWGGWGGRFESEKTVNAGSAMDYDAEFRAAQMANADYYMYTEARDTWPEGNTVWGLPEEEWNNSDDAPLWRWREAHFNEFQARMDWCVAEPAAANHNPVAMLWDDPGRTIVHVTALGGGSLELNASGSYDPDGDNLTYRWFVYPEAGSYSGSVELLNTDQPLAQVTLPSDGNGETIHVVLEVIDDSPIARLSAYRRVVITLSDTLPEVVDPRPTSGTGGSEGGMSTGGVPGEVENPDGKGPAAGGSGESGGSSSSGGCALGANKRPAAPLWPVGFMLSAVALLARRLRRNAT